MNYKRELSQLFTDYGQRLLSSRIEGRETDLLDELRRFFKDKLPRNGETRNLRGWRARADMFGYYLTKEPAETQGEFLNLVKALLSIADDSEAAADAAETLA